MKQKILKTLHAAVASELLSRVQSGGARPADISNAIKFLKDNGIDCLPEASQPMMDLTKHLPEIFAGPNAPSC